MNKIGVDTNIFIYTLDNSSPYHKICDNFLKDTENELFTTTKNISEFFAVCTKIGVEKEKILGLFNEIKTYVTILYPNQNTLKKFEILFEKYHPKGNRVYDIEIISMLTTNKINKIATINIDDFKYVSEIEIVNLDSYNK